MNYIRTKLATIDTYKLYKNVYKYGVSPVALGSGIYATYTNNSDIVGKIAHGNGMFVLVMMAGFAWPITVPIAITAYISTNAKNKKSNPYII